jgi:hypothetical protein
MDSALILPPVLKPDFGFTGAVLGAQKNNPWPCMKGELKCSGADGNRGGKDGQSRLKVRIDF